MKKTMYLSWSMHPITLFEAIRLLTTNSLISGILFLGKQHNLVIHPAMIFQKQLQLLYTLDELCLCTAELVVQLHIFGLLKDIFPDQIFVFHSFWFFLVLPDSGRPSWIKAAKEAEIELFIFIPLYWENSSWILKLHRLQFSYLLIWKFSMKLHYFPVLGFKLQLSYLERKNNSMGPSRYLKNE